MTAFLHLSPQFNKKNKGASLVTVLMAVSIVSILVTVIFAVVISNVYMKKADLAGQKNFYDAESAIEEIRAGLGVEVSDAVSQAYIDTMGNYSALPNDKKEEYFQNKYKTLLKNKLSVSQVQEGEKNYYSLTYMESLLRETAYKEVGTGANKKGVGAKVITPEGYNYINVEKDGVVLKNVTVSYVNGDGYYTQICTDICIEYPPIDFANISAMDNILCYNMIANKSFESKKGSTVEITGNSYLGSEGANISNTNVIYHNNSTQEGNIISGGNLTLENGASLSVNDGMQLWSNSMLINKNSSYTIDGDGATYLKNDMVLGDRADVKMGGRFILFGNPWVALEGAKSTVPSEVMKNMPEYSSSILVNGTKCSLDMTDVSTLVIGGSAYVNPAKSKEGADLSTGNRVTGGMNPIVTGQSLAVKSDQRAYLVPATVVGEGYQNGYSNPMTGNQYLALREEIINDILKNDTANKYQGKGENVPEKEIKAKMVSFNSLNTGIGVPLSAFNVTDYNMCAYQTSMGSMIYLFMQFETIGKPGDANYTPAEALANEFFRYYNSYASNKQRLMENLDYYAEGGIKLPQNISDKTCMYFTGNLVTNQPGSIIVQDTITQLDFIMDPNLRSEYSEQSVYYQDAYYTLRKILSTTYTDLKAEQKDKTLFENLIDKDTIEHSHSDNEYVSLNGEVAIVKKGDYTIGDALEEAHLKTLKDYEGNTHSNAEVNFLIATGDVTVKKDFKGVIIAGGDIIVENGTKGAPKISAAPDLAAIAMCAAKEGDQDDTAAKFVYNAANYLLGGIGTTDSSASGLSLSSFITYRNWTRQ